jgi:hypothetical protein
LTEWEKDSLFALFSSIDAKGVLEIQFNEASLNLYSAIGEDLTTVMLDSLVTNKAAATEEFNDKLRILSDGRNDLMNAQNDFNYSLILSIVSDQLINIRESSMEGKDLLRLKDLIEETISHGTSDSIIQLSYDGFASNYIKPELPLTYRMADLLINKFDPSGYHGDLEYPFGLPSTRSSFKPIKKEFILEIKSFPNPANGYFQIQSQGEDISNCLLSARDINGREVPVDILTKSRNEWFVNVNEWANGSYIIELRKDGKLVFSNNLIVKR